VPGVSRRRCSKPSCTQPAVSTLTYVYADSTAVVGPLATYAEPHCYDLCQMHTDRLTAPRGWEVVRITPDPEALKPSSDDLEALANAVREAARPRYEQTEPPEDDDDPVPGAARRGHLRVVPEIAKLQADKFDERGSHSTHHPAGSRSGADESFDHDRLW